MDISQVSLNEAGSRARALGLEDRIAFVCQDLEALWLEPDLEFDLVYSFGVLHHTPHPGKVLRRARRYLKRHGSLYVMLYHKWAYKWLWAYLKYGHENGWNWSKTIAARAEAQTGCPWATVWTKKSANQLLRDVGFIPYSMQIAHIFPYQVEPYINHEYVWAFPWSHLPYPVYRWAERHFGQHLLIKALNTPRREYGYISRCLFEE